MGWRIKSNHLPDIARAIPREVQKAVDDMGDDLSDLLTATVWKRSGLLSRVVTPRGLGPLKVEVAVGWYLGKGFYSGFQEFGTSHQGARPIVTPAAHEAEPIFASYVERAIERAVR